MRSAYAALGHSGLGKCKVWDGMNRLAPHLALLAVGALGLVACEGDDDGPAATDASATTIEPSGERGTVDARAGRSCGELRVAPSYPVIAVEVVEGKVSCRAARRVVKQAYIDPWPTSVPGMVRVGSWTCTGPEGLKECVRRPGATIGASFAGRWPAAEHRIKRIGNKWAHLFATGDLAACNMYMTQPACERISCTHMGGRRIPDCKPPSPAFRASFGYATVEEVVIMARAARTRYTRAAARFSNGHTIELDEVASGNEHPGGLWWISKVGGNAGRGLFEE
jgi:hypothetical protein